MTRRAKTQRPPKTRDGWNTTGQRIFATDLDDLADRTGLTVFERVMAIEALDAATAKAAWGRRQASPSPTPGKPAPALRTEPTPPGPEPTRPAPTQAPPPIARNQPPATVWEALRRLLACNRQELAARLGISRHTLQRWERGQIPEAGAARVASLMQATLAEAQAAWTIAPAFRPEPLQPGATDQPPR